MLIPYGPLDTEAMPVLEWANGVDVAPAEATTGMGENAKGGADGAETTAGW